ncbi:endonuclease/exonuclease/phosphatase family protein [Pontibacter sp. G13]|uniref:endonuclease/exonuclease/phosphatase family protein n=1 Tax=Pontibacter sp. G13 TaxID=3074898 RepID=UPI00288B8ADF|nr:endonuclease/exonuclease/phosphatase family protein [Pontibacter sp. G13]WNJ16249.1 hypothetical protein RJD25_15405 [Pontibacter sp. G13]
MKYLKLLFKATLGIILLIILYVGGMIAWNHATDFQPPLETVVEATAGSERAVTDTLNLTIWNIGYGGLGQASDFFNDGGKSTRTTRANTRKNLDAIYQQVESWKNDQDFILLQEVDQSSKRSYLENEMAEMQKRMNGFSSAFAVNYQVAYVPVPFSDPLGGTLSGLLSLSKATPTQSTRFSFEGNYDWPTYLFFLDRCFLLQRFPVEGMDRELVVINTHNSAYDDGTLKAKQMAQLRTVLLEEYEAGNYVIVGGDWNQFPPDFEGFKGYEMPRTAENENLFVKADYPSADWTWAWDPTTPTNRDLAAPFDPVATHRQTLDFFLLSPNVELLEAQATDLQFGPSDHQPVSIRVALTADTLMAVPADLDAAAE